MQTKELTEIRAIHTTKRTRVQLWQSCYVIHLLHSEVVQIRHDAPRFALVAAGIIGKESG